MSSIGKSKVSSIDKIIIIHIHIYIADSMTDLTYLLTFHNHNIFIQIHLVLRNMRETNFFFVFKGTSNLFQNVY